MSPRTRTALAAILLLPWLSACPEPPTWEKTHLPIVDMREDVEVIVEGPVVDVPAGLRVEWVEDGVAGVALPLTSADAKELPGAGRLRTWVWNLPLVPTRDRRGAKAEPRLEGLDVPRYVTGDKVDPTATGGWWVNEVRSELLVTLDRSKELPEGLELRYAAPAALLLGSGLLDPTDRLEVVRGRHLDGEVSVEALIVPTGATLRMQLPMMESGRLFGSLVADGDARAGTPEVRMTVDTKVLHDGELEIGADPVDVEALITLRRNRARVELVVQGPPGQLVYLTGPIYARTKHYADPPNVLLIVVDTLRADRMEVYGNKRKLTPALDRLASESLVFAQCWSTSSWTLPAMASLFTSSHGPQHRASLNTRRLGTGIDTMASLFREEGYNTAAFTGGGFVSPQFGLERGFIHFDGTGGGIEQELERARAWLEKAGDGPWFLLVHTYEVHSPYEPPEEAAAAVMKKHGDKLMGLPPEPHAFYDHLKNRPDLVPRVSGVLRALYDEEVRYADEKLGEFLDEFRDAGRYEDMVVCLTSDHGEEFGEHGLLGHGDTLYHEQLKVPFLLHLPKKKRRGEMDWRPVSHIDLAPTVLDAAGLGDRSRRSSFRGLSLLSGSQPSLIYASRDDQQVGLLELMRQGSIVWIDGSYRHSRGVEPGELYDLATDEGQRANLAPSKPGQVKKNRMQLGFFKERFDEPVTEDYEAAPDATLRMQLQGLGYFGEE